MMEEGKGAHSIFWLYATWLCGMMCQCCSDFAAWKYPWNLQVTKKIDPIVSKSGCFMVLLVKRK
jgi:hypothetical protein